MALVKLRKFVHLGETQIKHHRGSASGQHNLGEGSILLNFLPVKSRESVTTAPACRLQQSLSAKLCASGRRLMPTIKLNLLLIQTGALLITGLANEKLITYPQR